MSEKIANAKVYGPMPTDKGLVDAKRGADSAGFQARQHGRTGADVDIDDSWKGNSPTMGPPEDVITRENEENQRTVSMRRRIDEIVGDSMTYGQKQAILKAQMRRKFEEAGFGDMIGNVSEDVSMGNLDPFEAGAIRGASQPRASRDDLGELEPPQNDQFNQKGMWMVEEMTAKTKAGTQVLIWQVSDPNTGIKLPHMFRISETADKVVAVLNRTGNLNDPRIGQWINIDKQRTSLISKARQLKEAYAAGNRSVKPQYDSLREQIAELDLKIGI